MPERLRRVVHLGLKAAAALAILAVAAGLFYFCLSLRYDLAAIHHMPERSIVSDRHGTELATIHGENRRLITRDEIPPFFVEALMAREDQRFMTHLGVDVRGLARAFLRNVRDRSFTQGASTVTMQLARNSLDLGEHDLHRKGLELALAMRIEERFSKDDILTAYVNRIYFGSGCHGLEEAARRYFDRPASELNANQCALLAGIIRAPHAWSPRRDLDGALAQRDEVLARLVTNGVIDAREAARVHSLPLGLADEDAASSGNAAMQAIRRHFETILAAQDIHHGGLRLASTLDAGMQSALEAQLATILAHVDPEVQAAAVCVECRTGAIRAIVGGRADRPGFFNRALDARRDVGSVMAPFIFAAAAERRTTLHAGEPVRTGRQVGCEDLVRLVKRLGFTGPFIDGDDLYRGALAATPLELATAGATLRNAGRRPRTFLLDEIRDADNHILFANKPTSTSALDAEAAAASLELFLPSRENAGATIPIVTGRSLSRQDAWGLAIGKRYATTIWLGYDQPERLDISDDALELLHNALAALDRPSQAP